MQHGPERVRRAILEAGAQRSPASSSSSPPRAEGSEDDASTVRGGSEQVVEAPATPVSRCRARCRSTSLSAVEGDSGERSPCGGSKVGSDVDYEE